MELRDRIVGGMVAGAAGTFALNAVTYLDMVWRGRPASELPGEAATRLAKPLGIDLQGDDDATKNRRSAAGALLGMATGVGVAAAYSIARGGRAGGADGVVVGALAMAASDVPLVALGLTNPRTWGAAGWISDAVPHLAYGAAVTAVLRRW